MLLLRKGIDCHVWRWREIEFYYPQEVMVAAQQGDTDKEKEVTRILKGNQNKKFIKEAGQTGVCVPSGRFLRKLLNEHVKEKMDLPDEVREIIEEKLIPAKCEILGEESGA